MIFALKFAVSQLIMAGPPNTSVTKDFGKKVKVFRCVKVE